MKKSQRARQAGATLLEALAFLGIAAIIVVGAISMFRAAQGSAQSNAMVSELNSHRAAIKTIYATQGYGGATTYDLSGTISTAGLAGISRALFLSKSLPDSYVNKGLMLFGTSYGATFKAYAGVSTDGTDLFILNFSQVSQEICLKVAPQIGGAWLGLQINGNPFVLTDSQTFPVATADAQCTPGTSNTMLFVSR